MNKLVNRILLGAVIMGVAASAYALEMSDQTVGTVVGGVAGGALGSQIGGGRGKELATVGGTIAGAVIGGNIGREKDQAHAQQAAYIERQKAAHYERIGYERAMHKKHAKHHIKHRRHHHS